MRFMAKLFVVALAIATLAACTDRGGTSNLLPSTAVRHVMDNGGGIPGKSRTAPSPTPSP
jgi:hypothetical protein